jgi:uroporphyrinogen decarboxylase
MTDSRYSAKDRLIAATGEDRPDRVPVMTYSNHFQIRQAGYTYGEVLEDGEKFVEAQVDGREKFGYDGVTGLGGPGMIADALGAELLVSEDESPSMTEPGLTGERAEVDLNELYSRSLTDGEFVSFTVGVNQKLVKAVGPDVPLVASVSSPFREACLLRGFERLFGDMIREPSFVESLVELMTEKVYEYARLMAEAGADVLGITDPFASSAMISRPQFEDLVYPSEKEIIDLIHRNTEARVLFHTCGEWGDRFDLAVQAGADIYHIDGVGRQGLEEIRRSHPGPVIMGRIPTTGLLLKGSPEEVRSASEVSIDSAGDGGNYILAGNCSLPPETPAENLEAMVETARLKGTYPLEKTGAAGEEREVYFG